MPRHDAHGGEVRKRADVRFTVTERDVAPVLRHVGGEQLGRSESACGVRDVAEPVAALVRVNIIQGEQDVLRRDGHAVIPGHPFAHGERDVPAVLGFGKFRKQGRVSPVRIPCDQRLLGESCGKLVEVIVAPVRARDDGGRADDELVLCAPVLIAGGEQRRDKRDGEQQCGE